MTTSSRAPSKPAPPAGFTQLAAGKAFVTRAARRGRKGKKRISVKRWTLRLLIAVAALVVLWRLFLVAVSIATTDMWFNSVRAGSVYETMLEARIVLFVVFAVIGGVVGGAALVAVRRIRPKLDLSSDYDTFRWTFRKYEPRFRRLLLLLGVAVPAVLIGQQAQAGWQTYLLWRNAVSFHRTDPVFHKDISFFVDIYPFHQMVVTLLISIVTYGLWIAVIAGYWYGAWRLRRDSRKITKGFTQLVSVLLVAYLVLQAVNYWISRYGLTTSNRGPVTGAAYTDIAASLPGKYVMSIVLLLGAVALVLNLLRRSRVRMVAGAVIVTIVVTQIVGSAWPGLLYHFREAPSAAKLDLREIADNQKATRAAFGLDGNVRTIGYDSSKTTDTATTQSLAATTAQASVIDPNQLSPTFNVKQQLQAYYSFKSTLDTSHYDLDGKSQDVALAVRELRSAAIPSKSWVNSHLVYTHGYGVVAAPTTQVDPTSQGPVFLNGGLPPSQQIPVTRPQVYFGQGFGSSSSYSIVGQNAGTRSKVEFDHPGSEGSTKSAFTTYQGHGGIPVGSSLRRLLFAVQMRSPNIFFSSELNDSSQLLTVRNPRARVAKIAPWLTLDGDVYPAVVNGQIKWIVDGYTTSANYPESQLINTRSATSTTLVKYGASVAQPKRQINYMQNSVKAVVDAYTGKVSLYSWNQSQHPDPLLKAWESVFPGLVKPQSDISSALLSQMRYPTDLFNVQRALLARYHVTQPSSFYSGNDFWSVPKDPTVIAANTINSSNAGGVSKSGAAVAGALQPSRYMSMSSDGFGTQSYRLSTPMVTLNGRDLAAFISVDAQPGANYGKFTVLDFPSSSAGESPSQVQNDIESDTTITEALTLQRGGNSNVVLGALEAIPVAGRILYVEPVYTQSTGGASFPILRHVIALYADGQPSFESKLRTAILGAIRSSN